MARITYRESVEGAVRRNYARGFVSPETWPEWDDPRCAGQYKPSWRLTWSPKCDNPYRFAQHGAASVRVHGKRRPITLHGEGRCRKCEACMEARAYHWRERAMAEFKAWPRTYMGTITMSPEQHYLIDSQIMQGERAADGRFIRHPKNLRELSPDELFHARASLFGQQVTLWLKRVRKRYGVNAVRYLLVAEAHDSGKTSDVMRGRPHYHILVHECELGHVISGDPVLALQTGRNGDFEKRLIRTSEGFMPYLFVTDDAFIRKNWGLGFTKFQLATSEKSVLYLCKYLSKSMLSRVRASVDYGLGVSLKPVTQEPVAIGPSSL